MKTKIDIRDAIKNLKAHISKADTAAWEWFMVDDSADPSWIIESCFLHLLAIAEALDLPEFRRMINEQYIKIKTSERGFTAAVADEFGDPYSAVLLEIRRFFRILEGFFPIESKQLVIKELLQILRDVHYTITDTRIFPNSPENEREIHLRIEGILKCVFPDLKHKPTLTKQIKNFEPDTGIPSLKTLIEYKFLSRREDIPLVADQILADTRGYTSKDWSRFIYIIYETNRFRTEHDWNQFLRETGVPENTTVVVLGGEPPKKAKTPPLAKK